MHRKVNHRYSFLHRHRLTLLFLLFLAFTVMFLSVRPVPARAAGAERHFTPAPVSLSVHGHWVSPDTPQVEPQILVSRGGVRQPVTRLHDGDRVRLSDFAPTPAISSYAFSQCTWWAASRRAQLGRPVGRFWGDARWWADSARAQGMRVDHTPQVGAVVVFQPGEHGADSVYGHVGVVEYVVDAHTVLISEVSAFQNGVGDIRRVSGELTFIH